MEIDINTLLKGKGTQIKGKEYLSKIQCIVLEGITRKELEAYLKNNAAE